MDYLEYKPCPNRNERRAVLLIPGGAYYYIGKQDVEKPVEWCHNRHFHVWVLYYTCAKENKAAYPAPMNEARAAVKAIRETGRIDILIGWGFSAGAHLLAITGTESRLNGMILSYPVISMENEDITHVLSRNNLLGENATRELKQQMSAETRVSDATPPVFIFHTAEDEKVPVRNSLLFAEKMDQFGRPFSLCIQAKGLHGVGMGDWTGALDPWLQEVTSGKRLITRSLAPGELELHTKQALLVQNYKVYDG
ncbi:endo-1,4-beta-xylanase B [Hypoxylon sp. FL0890]|nr:endo-1,4-beta-xylanase B [Hypoxylon sp. FL0890]